MRAFIALAASSMLLSVGSTADAGSTQVNWVGSRSIVRRSTGFAGGGRAYTYHEDGNGNRVVPVGQGGPGVFILARRQGGRSGGSSAAAQRAARRQLANERRQLRNERARTRRAVAKIARLRTQLAELGFQEITTIGEGREATVTGSIPLEGGALRQTIEVSARGGKVRRPLATKKAQRLLDRFYAQEAARLEYHAQSADHPVIATLREISEATRAELTKYGIAPTLEPDSARAAVERGREAGALNALRTIDARWWRDVGRASRAQ